MRILKLLAILMSDVLLLLVTHTTLTKLVEMIHKKKTRKKHYNKENKYQVIKVFFATNNKKP